MPEAYFSDRERGARPRTKLELPSAAWGGIVALVDTAITSGAFGAEFPDECSDGRGTIGTNSRAMGLAVRADIPELEWPLDDNECPPTLVVLDLVEFCVRHIAKPQPYEHHGYLGHDHLAFDREAGESEFRERINRIFARNQIAYELAENGHIIRLAAPVLDEVLTSETFDTGNEKLDDLLELARAKFLDPDPAVRREALEKLWDAFERVKTLEPGKDKKASVQALLEKASNEHTLRQLLRDECKSLTKAGNTFHIRHSETTQIELETEDHVDYLFHRLFALIWLLLRAR
jgi:hypothetical protein